MNIVERREIEFDPGSVIKAITASLKAANWVGLPTTPPTGVRFHPNIGTVELIYGTNRTGRAVSITAEVLGTLLISYCVRAGIPMPRNADKGIRLESDAVILAFRVRTGGEPPVRPPVGASRAAGSATAWKWLDPRDMPPDA